MAITSSDIAIVKSSNIGSAGGGISGSVEVSGTYNNFWDNVNAAQSSVDGNETKKFFVRNDNGSDDLPAYKLWDDQLPLETHIAMGVGVDSADDDDPLQGNLVAFGGSAFVSLTSSGADTRTATIIGAISGTPLEENVVLTGSSEVLSASEYDVLYAVVLSAEHGSNTVTIKEGSGGSTRGTIPPNKMISFLWIVDGEIRRVALPSGSAHGFWTKMSWSGPVGPDDPNQEILAIDVL